MSEITQEVGHYYKLELVYYPEWFTGKPWHKLIMIYYLSNIW